ncbi:metal ABC transporter permease [Thiohalobacter thiocyanaticus]|uniref:Metal ABC transporter permease n=2 Tax=Thiohalobacter thiocyanaticus TaxID=585455 RepID=A0A426QHX9_9GAMM|nr:metal ABC transporter permease [Thiohalobacter thiocyanaticus]
MLEILLPALVAGLAIAVTHAPLGLEVLRRGIIFIDLAIAQIAGLGLVVMELYWPGAAGWMLQAVALGCALGASLLFHWTERRLPAQQEALIGSSFVLAASLALLLLADHPHGGEAIQHLLSGQLLFVGWNELGLALPVYGLVLLAWFARPRWRGGMGFYLLFALAVTASVQLAGVYVVFASLILPALAAAAWPGRALAVAWTSAAVAILAGLMAALWYDWPAGPVLVVSYALVALLATVPRWRRTRPAPSARAR